MTVVAREEWLEVRRTGIGSSDAAAVCGLDPWRSAYGVYLDKVGDATDRDSDAMRWGRRLEAAVADEFADLHDDLEVIAPPEPLYRSAAWPHMVASPDRLAIHADGTVEIVEIKTSSAHVADMWDDGPPDHYQLQVQHQLAVCDLRRARLAVLIGGRDYREYELVRDDALIGDLVDIETEFWGRVLERRPPPIDGSEATSDALRRLHARSETGLEIDLPDDTAELLRDLDAAKAVRADADEDVRRAEAALMALLGPAEVGRLDGQIAVTWRAVESRRLDSKRLRAERPDVASEYETTSSSRRLLVKKGDWG